MLNARSLAVKVLSETERNGSYSNIAIDSALNGTELSKEDSALFTRLIYGVLQRKITLDAVISKLCEKGASKLHPFVKSVLRIGLYQIFYLDKIPDFAAVNESVNIVKQSKQSFAAGLVNAVLRRALREKDELLIFIENSEDDIKYSCPKEFMNELISYIGKDEACDFLKASLEAPKTYARVNIYKTDIETFLKNDEKEGLIIDGIDDNGVFSVKINEDLQSNKSFKNGEFFIQDIASAKAIEALNIIDGNKVLDVCAAPGGKSFTAAQYTKSGEIVSCDIYEKRVGLIKSGAVRLGIGNLTAKVNDASRYNADLGLFDRVICDVPCSGFGVLRRKPEIKYKKLSEVVDLPEIQLNILNTSVKYLKENGLILYSTCTVRYNENQGIVKKFLKDNKDFSLVTERLLLPSTDGTDGFYYSVLRRDTRG